MRFWRAGTGHVRGGGQYDLMESVSAKGGFEPASELTSKQVRSKIESYGFGLRRGGILPPGGVEGGCASVLAKHVLRGEHLMI